MVARGAEQAEALPLPGHLVPQHIDVVAVVLPAPQLPIADRAAVPLRFVHRVTLALEDGLAFRPEEHCTGMRPLYSS